jgi:mono/diheme cytochrome c family protein
VRAKALVGRTGATTDGNEQKAKGNSCWFHAVLTVENWFKNVPTDPVRAGQALFFMQCFPCHKLNGAGASDVGPDLNLPQNPTEYLTPQGLHDMIRNPRAVRTWPAQAMPPFPPDYLSDRDTGLVIAYLKHMAGRKQAQ